MPVMFAVDFLQVFDRTVFVLFPLAPLMTALLALIGQYLVTAYCHWSVHWLL